MACDLCVAFSRHANLKMPEFVGFFFEVWERYTLLFLAFIYLKKFKLEYS